VVLVLVRTVLVRLFRICWTDLLAIHALIHCVAPDRPAVNAHMTDT